MKTYFRTIEQAIKHTEQLINVSKWEVGTGFLEKMVAMDESGNRICAVYKTYNNSMKESFYSSIDNN